MICPPAQSTPNAVRFGTPAEAPGKQIGLWRCGLANQARVDELAGAEIDALLDEMRTNRRLMLLRRLTPEQRARPMPFRAHPTLPEEMVPILIGHLDQHTAELARL